MTRRKVTEQELRGIPEHIAYELSMCLMVLDRLTSHPLKKSSRPFEDAWRDLGPDEKMTWNVLIESFLLHLRTLTEFFWDPEKETQKNRDSVQIKDMFPGWRGDLHRGHRLAHNIDKANGYVMHLSYDRVNNPPAQHDWPVDQLLCDLEPSFQEMIKSAKKRSIDLGSLPTLVMQLGQRCGKPNEEPIGATGPAFAHPAPRVVTRTNTIAITIDGKTAYPRDA